MPDFINCCVHVHDAGLFEDSRRASNSEVSAQSASPASPPPPSTVGRSTTKSQAVINKQLQVVTEVNPLLNPRIKSRG